MIKLKLIKQLSIDEFNQLAFTRVIAHEKRLKDVDKELEQIFEAIGSDKTFPLLIRLISLYLD